MKTVSVKINGLEYNLKGKEDEEYLLNVAGYVDSKIREISSSRQNLGSTSIAVLAALNIADELYKVDGEAVELEKKKNSLEERHQTLKERIKELRAECDVAIAERDNEIVTLRTNITTMMEKFQGYDELLNISKEYELLKEKFKSIESKMEEDKSFIKALKEERKKDIEVIEAQAEEIKTFKNMIANDYVEKTAYNNAISKVNDLVEENKVNSNLLIEVEEIKSENLKLKDILSEYKNKEIIFEENIEKLQDKDDEINSIKKMLTEREMELKEQELLYKKKEAEIIEQKNSSEELEFLKEKLAMILEENEKMVKSKKLLESKYKEISFDMKNYKYKVLDLEKKLVDSHIMLAKEKKDRNPLIVG